MADKCCFEHTDRSGLYIMIIIILLSLCNVAEKDKQDETLKRLDRIEAKVDSLKIKVEGINP